jgi:hypothetical protein
VTCDDEVVVGVRGNDVVDVLHDVVADHGPGVPEAEFGFATVTETRVSVGEFDVGDPVADGVGATESQYNCLVGVVHSDIAGSIGGCGAIVLRYLFGTRGAREILLGKFIGNVGIGCLDLRAVTSPAGQLGASLASVVGFTVRSSSILDPELELGQLIGRDV